LTFFGVYNNIGFYKVFGLLNYGEFYPVAMNRYDAFPFDGWIDKGWIGLDG
jgi:hypothetical protein